MVAENGIILIQTSTIHAKSEFLETIAVLQAVHNREVQVNLAYLTYAQKAVSENYPNIAHLFGALAASEWIHARNFRQLLFDLGIEMKRYPEPEIRASTTKANLKNATRIEIEEIDRNYPQFIERIKSERYEPAIRDLTYAWESEKQHRKLIEKIRSGTGIFFGILARTIEKTPYRYFVCQACGFTISSTSPPENPCPVCKSPVSHFKEIERIR